MNKLTISVPATSANVGPGFDSAGLAVNRYLTLHVALAKKWSIEHNSPNLPIVPNYVDHLIYQIAKKTAEKHEQTLPACHVDVKSDIPLTRGLGSSAAAVLAGIELANQVCDLSLTAEQKLQYGTRIEGHADNVAPALFGGFILTANVKSSEMNYIKLPALDLRVVLFIPNIELKTKASRTVLPTMFAHEEAARANGIGNVMIASLLTGDYKQAGKMMEHDLLHEPYRAKLIPNFYEIRKNAKELGAYGTVISGAGPTVISFVPSENEGKIITEMKKYLPDDYEVIGEEIDNDGLQVHNN